MASAVTRGARVGIVATLAVAVSAALASYAGVSLLTGPDHPAAAEAGSAAATDGVDDVIEVSLDDCGSAWRPGPAGWQELTVHDVDSRPGEVRIVGTDAAHAGQVFGDLEPIGVGTTLTLRVRLAAGQYALQCLFEEQSPVTGAAQSVTGPGAGVRGVEPIAEPQLIRSTLRYTRWVASQLPALQRTTAQLAAQVHAGDRAAARSTWLRAHAAYERLGAAYDAFGDLDGAINGLPGGSRRGPADPGFTGFHRVELDLWGGDGASRAEQGAHADRLAADVAALGDQLAGEQLDPLTFSIRAHEISENLLRTALTGADDLGSHSDLATVAAGLDGTTQVLAMLRKHLAGRYPHPARLFHDVARARHLVAHLAAGAAGHRAVADWPRVPRQRVDAAVGELTEALAPVATVLEPRRTS